MKKKREIKRMKTNLKKTTHAKLKFNDEIEKKSKLS